MAQRFNDDFKREVVRTFQTSGLPQRQVAADFGIGLSTIGKWLVKFGAQTGMNQAQLEQQKEIACLARAQNRSGGEGCVKKGSHLLRGAKAMRFAFINSYRGALGQTHLCRIFAVTTRGLRAWRVRPLSARAREIWTREGWLYLAVVIDLFSRKIIGWASSNRLKRDLALRALQMAILRHHPSAGCIHHSDRGSQYCAYDYQKLLKAHGLVASMSGKGNAYDNAACETFFKTIKAELIWRGQWITREQTNRAIASYIDGFYNPRRRHSAIGYLSPIKFEASQRLNYAA